MPTGNTGFTSM